MTYESPEFPAPIPEVSDTFLPPCYSRLISSISARLVKVSSEDLDAEILRSLAECLQPLGVERGGLLHVDKGSPIVRVSHAWYAEGVDQVSNEINLAEWFPWSYRQIVVQGNIVNLPDCSNLPAEAEVDRQSFAQMGARSSLTIPLFIGDRVHHIIAVHALGVQRQWPDEFIMHLRLLGEIFVSALQRREAEKSLSRAKERLKLAAASANAGLWELFLDNGSLWMTEKTSEMFGFAVGQEVSFEQFLGHVHVDDRQLIHAAIEAACRDKTDAQVEYRLASGDGQVRWMYSAGRYHEGGADGPGRLAGVTMEITERKGMEQQLTAQLREIKSLRDQLENENFYLRDIAAPAEKMHEFSAVGSSMRGVLAQVHQVARTGSTVLIEGETGAGKELIAQAIHRLSDRGKRVMIKVNCAALPAPLMESELFGREKGAFTGALTRQPGRFELADKSTLFLDEVAELPPDTQAKLLRVLQDGEFERLGSPRTIKVDVRVVAATNRDLAREVEQGRFRRDLYYRLNVFPIKVPPLRERTEEIPQLVWEFVAEFGEKMGKRIRQIASRDMEMLKAYTWPGNIRELRNVIERALIVSNGEVLSLQGLIPAAERNHGAMTLVEAERRHIQRALQAAGGKVKGAGGAAELLGMNPSTLNSRLRKLGIQPQRL